MALEGRRGGGKPPPRGNPRGASPGPYADRYANIFCLCIHLYSNHIGNVIFKKKNPLSVLRLLKFSLDYKSKKMFVLQDLFPQQAVEMGTLQRPRTGVPC